MDTLQLTFDQPRGIQKGSSLLGFTIRDLCSFQYDLCGMLKILSFPKIEQHACRANPNQVSALDVALHWLVPALPVRALGTSTPVGLDARAVSLASSHLESRLRQAPRSNSGRD